MEEQQSIDRMTCYEEFLDEEGLPVIRDYYIKSIRNGLLLSVTERLSVATRASGKFAYLKE